MNLFRRFAVVALVGAIVGTFLPSFAGTASAATCAPTDVQCVVLGDVQQVIDGLNGTVQILEAIAAQEEGQVGVLLAQAQATAQQAIATAQAEVASAEATGLALAQQAIADATAAVASVEALAQQTAAQLEGTAVSALGTGEQAISNAITLAFSTLNSALTELGQVLADPVGTAGAVTATVVSAANQEVASAEATANQIAGQLGSTAQALLAQAQGTANQAVAEALALVPVVEQVAFSAEATAIALTFVALGLILQAPGIVLPIAKSLWDAEVLTPIRADEANSQTAWSSCSARYPVDGSHLGNAIGLLVYPCGPVLAELLVFVAAEVAAQVVSDTL